MESLKELQKWVQSLTKGEKRSITLLGKARAGNASSQQLILFEWLNSANLEKETLTDVSLLRNLPTVTSRLKELILDGLRLLHKNANIDAEIRQGLDNAANLVEKRLLAQASRLLQQTKTRAMESSRYASAIQCIQMECQMLIAQPHTNEIVHLRNLRNEELRCIQSLSNLQDLQYRYGLLRTKSKQLMATRIPAELEEVRRLVADGFVERMQTEGAYLEQALAANILGIANLFERESLLALERYKGLLLQWKQHPKWQIDQGPLLYNISVMYSIACATSPLPWKKTKQYLELLPDFGVFSPSIALEYQSTLNLNRFAFALNQGNLSLMASLIVETDRRLRKNEKELVPRIALAFLYNMAITEFIVGNHSNALKFVVRIVNMPKPKVREDIREFALVLRAVLLFELEETSLNEYLTRSGKRYFKKNSREFEFELAVFQFLEKAIRLDSQIEINAELNKLLSDLDRLLELVPGTVPLLGLTEMRLWAEAKRSRRSLREVFLQAVKENLDRFE